MQSSSYFVHLIGFAGSGKLSIAKHLAPQLSALLVGNHHVNNVILGLIEPDGLTPLAAGVWDNIRQVRAAVLDTVLHHAMPGRRGDCAEGQAVGLTGVSGQGTAA